MKWISVDVEEPPKDGTSILVCLVNGDYEVAKYFRSWQQHLEPAGNGLCRLIKKLYYVGYGVDDFTHWMPLPSPPDPPEEG